MTRNREAVETTEGDGTPFARGVGALLTLLLLAPATALLVARIRDLVTIDRTGLHGCSGADTVGPVLQAGLPVILLLLVIPSALISLGNRARGWIWLALALVATVLVEVGLRLWLPTCL